MFGMGSPRFMMPTPEPAMMSMGGARGAMRSIGGASDIISSTGGRTETISPNWYWNNYNMIREGIRQMELMTREGIINPMNPMGAFMNPMMSMGGTMDVMKSGNSNNNCNGGTMDVMKSGNSNNNCNGGTIDVMKSGPNNNCNVPSSTTITYEGILNAAYFKLNSKEEKKTINIEISLSSVKNPISNEKEVWIGTLFKSKYDGQKINKLIDLSIALDISGSMRGDKIIMAKKALIKLIQKLNDDDNISISKFNNKSEQVFPCQKVKKLKEIDYASELEKIHPSGGTNILLAFKEAYNSITMENCNKNKIRRIIIITDMEDNVNKTLTEFCEKISKEGIYISILGISSSFRTDLAELISHVKGANYVVITEIKDINKYLVEDFEYLCFPNATNINLEVTTPYIKFERIVGSGKEGIEEITDKTGWNLEKHKYYSDEFKEKIFFLLLYFKRKNMILPKPVIFILSEFLVPGVKKEISNIPTCFPSQLKILGDKKFYAEGGMILLRLN